MSTLGDDLYPDPPDFAGTQEEVLIEETLEESRKSCARVHRMEFISRHDVKTQCDIELPNGQLSPSPGLRALENMSHL